MRIARTALGFGLALVAAPALGESWVTVYDDDPIWAAVDQDSIRRGDDGLVYFRSDGPDKADRAVDCPRRQAYTLKLYVMDGIDYPDWRSQGRAVVEGSAGEAELQYVCTHN